MTGDLSLPFFDDGHRRFAVDLKAWVEAQDLEEEVEHHDGPATDAACRRLVAALGQDGWLRHVVPASHGGHAETLDARTLCIARSTLAYRSALADFAFAMQGLGSGAITLAGTEAQKARWLPGVAAGSLIPAFALSEPDAGSDVANIATTARRDGDHFVLDGGKTWISNWGIADFYVVFARSGEAPGSRGLSAFVVEAGTPGFTTPERITVLAPHPIGTLRFEGCRVPAANLIGRPGEGFKVAMATLDIFRSTVAAAALGFARRALDETLAWVTQRRIAGQLLADMAVTRQTLGQMATEIDAAALLVYRAAWVRDTVGGRTTREAAMAKVQATEMAQRVIDRAVQLQGGLGVTSGRPVERLYRDIRPLRIYEGATEVQWQIIARQLLDSYAAGRGSDG